MQILRGRSSFLPTPLSSSSSLAKQQPADVTRLLRVLTVNETKRGWNSSVGVSLRSAKIFPRQLSGEEKRKKGRGKIEIGTEGRGG